MYSYGKDLGDFKAQEEVVKIVNMIKKELSEEEMLMYVYEYVVHELNANVYFNEQGEVVNHKDTSLDADDIYSEEFKYDEYDEYDKCKPILEVYKDDYEIWLQDDIETEIWNVINNIEGLLEINEDGVEGITLYRGMTITSEKLNRIKDKNDKESISLGDCWSMDRSVAYEFGSVGNGEESIIMEGFIDISKIDWQYTIILNLNKILGEEKEIRLYQDCEIILKSIEEDSKEIIEINKKNCNAWAKYERNIIEEYKENIKRTGGWDDKLLREINEQGFENMDSFEKVAREYISRMKKNILSEGNAEEKLNIKESKGSLGYKKV